MSVVDASALVAILGDEPERDNFIRRINAEEFTYISTASLLEVRIVLFSRFGNNGVLALDSFLLKSGMTVVEVSPRMGEIAFEAYRRFGKGTGHGASLNYGDCFSYALAKYLEAPLLFKGGDFSRTDLPLALGDAERATRQPH